MMRFCLMVFCCLVVLDNSQCFAQYSTFYFFGDSATDRGNTFRLTGAPVSPPYFDGRYTNGITWGEHLSMAFDQEPAAASLNGGTNFAYGAALTGSGHSPVAPLVPNVGTVIADFIASGGTFEGRELVTVWAGFNDLALDVDPDTIVSNLSDHVRSLYSVGARNFLLPNLAGNNREAFARFNTNWAAEQSLLGEELDDVNIIPYDSASVTADMFENRENYGFLRGPARACPTCNALDPLLDAETTTVAENPDEHLWWDTIHLGRVAHAVLGKQAIETVRLAAGDFDGDGALGLSDLDMLLAEISETPNRRFDLNVDNAVTTDDARIWVHRLANTYFGDANLDGAFNSGDFVQVFQGGKYETGAEAGWGDGDWNIDGVFNSGDFIVAFQNGGYEQGPRGAVRAVPEPTDLLGLIAALTGVAIFRRR